MAITIKSEREIELMAEAGKILERVHNELEKALHPGMSTKDIDTLGEKIIRSYGCIPSFLNYNGYPASICVSVNQEVVHGIPDKHRIIHEGDIVSLDAGVIYKGYVDDLRNKPAIIVRIFVGFDLNPQGLQQSPVYRIVRPQRKLKEIPVIPPVFT